MDEQGDWINKAALAAYRLINPDGPAFSTLTVSERNRWRDAYGVARAISPTIILTKTMIELSESSFDYAVCLLGIPPFEQLTISAGSYYRGIAQRLCALRGCRWIELPEDALKTRYTWIIRSPDGAVWSAPSD
jgi:hypothetical protein